MSGGDGGAGPSIDNNFQEFLFTWRRGVFPINWHNDRVCYQPAIWIGRPWGLNATRNDIRNDFFVKRFRKNISKNKSSESQRKRVQILSPRWWNFFRGVWVYMCMGDQLHFFDKIGEFNFKFLRETRVEKRARLWKFSLKNAWLLSWPLKVYSLMIYQSQWLEINTGLFVNHGATSFLIG